MAFIILDRDGVINYDSEDYIKSPDEWQAIPGSLEAIAELNRAGFRILVATNQSGIARGYYDIKMLERIHSKMMAELLKVGGCIDEIFFCPHHPENHCECRKPKPGLLYQMKNKYPIEFEKTFFIGDSIVDVEAAQSARCLPLLVLSGKNQTALQLNQLGISVPTFENLVEASQYVLSCQKKNND